MRESKTQTGFSLIELLIVVAVILIIVAIAIPSLLRARIASNESATVGNIRTITTALVAYTVLFPACGYPNSLTRLQPGTPVSNAAAGLLDATTAADTLNKSGYTVTYTLVSGVGDCVGEPGNGFEIRAKPQLLNRTGVRGFFTDASFIIRAGPNGNADATSPML